MESLQDRLRCAEKGKEENMKDGEVQVTLYRWAGHKWFWEIRSECEECDLAVHLIRELLKTELRGAPIQFEVKNWLDHVGESLKHGGWHPPVVLVNNRLVSQGEVPSRERLVQSIRAVLTSSQAG